MCYYIFSYIFYIFKNIYLNVYIKYEINISVSNVFTFIYKMSYLLLCLWRTLPDVETRGSNTYVDSFQQGCFFSSSIVGIQT